MEFYIFWRLILIINVDNGTLLNSKEVYIHDDILEELKFTRSEKTICLSILKVNKNSRKRYSIEFINVIGFEMTSCDFWGSSPHILDFEYLDNNEHTIIPNLFEKKYEYRDLSCNLNDKNKYIETMITFVSGDQLRIACESIII